MEALSSDDDLFLPLSASEEDREMLRKLYDPVQPSYFADKEDAVSYGNESPLKRIYTWAQTSPIVPQVKQVNLNTIGADEMDASDPGSKKAIEIGVKITF